MKLHIFRNLAILLLLSVALPAFAQDGADGSTLTSIGLVILAALILLFVVLNVADNLLAVEAKQSGVDAEKSGVSLFPSLSSLFSKPLPSALKGEHVVRLDRGFDIPLEGAVESTDVVDAAVNTFALKPTDFRGIAPIPKLLVEVGATVKAGDPLFFDKSNEAIKYAAPVSGEVIAINRGEKRSIAEIVILADKTQEYRSFNTPDTTTATREELVDFLVGSGAWQLIRQRPFEVIADPAITPANIFVSTFDTAPLAPDSTVAIKGQEAAFHRGLEVLAKLTSGDVHLGLDGSAEAAPAFQNAPAKKHFFLGKHPAGNVGVQIHHISPIDPDQPVWVLGVQDVISMGRLFLDGKLVLDRVIAIAGDEVERPQYIRTKIGASLKEVLPIVGLKNENVRIIDGDVLSGTKLSADGYIGFYSDQISVIEEGDYYEMFGWLLPQKTRPSLSRTFPNFLFSDLKFDADTNMHGEERAFVVTGQYESVLPMDVYPQHLMKAIMANDFERMQGLGLHELVEEDIAICEFVCTSKQPLQQILREGLDVMREQG